MLVDRQVTWRQNEVMQARLRHAELRNNTSAEDIDYRSSRGLDKALIRMLTQESAWMAKNENIFVCGPPGPETF